MHLPLPEKTEDTHSQIVRAAHTLFLKQGYHGTSVRQIAAEAGIALGGIYNHFSGKEDIFRAVLWAYHPYSEILPLLEQVSDDNVENSLPQAARALLTALDHNPDFLNLVFIEIVEFNSVHIGELIGELMPRISAFAPAILQRDPRVRKFPLPVLLRSFLGMFFAYYMTGKLLSGSAPAEFSREMLDDFIDIYLHGILLRESGEVGGAP